MNKWNLFTAVKVSIVLAVMGSSACSSVPSRPGVDMASVPDAVPRIEPLSKSGNPESYKQFGKRYWVLPSPYGFVEKGKASWYGKKFHGRRTSSGETYDMYAMSAAHKTLPIPTYAQVRNVDNGKSVVVRINDRGPFVDGRILDLSYTAASRLGVVGPGTANIELRVIDPRGLPSVMVASTKPVAAATPPPRSVPVKASNPAPVVISMAKVAPPAAVVKVVHMPIIKPAAKSAPMPLASVHTAQIKRVEKVLPTPVPSRKVAVQKSAAAGIYLQLGAYSSAGNAEASRMKLQGLQPHRVEVKTVRDSLGVLYRVRVGPLESEAQARVLGNRLKPAGYDQYRVIQ